MYEDNDGSGAIRFLRREYVELVALVGSVGDVAFHSDTFVWLLLLERRENRCGLGRIDHGEMGSEFESVSDGFERRAVQHHDGAGSEWGYVVQ